MYYTLSYQFFSPLVCLVNLLLLSRILENITVNAWSAGVSFGVNYKLRVFKDAKLIQEVIRTTFCLKTVDETKPKSHVSFEDFFRLNKQNASSSPECDILRHMYMSPIVQHWLQQSIAPKKYLGCPIDLPHLQGGGPTIPRHCSLLYLRTPHHHHECCAAALNFVGQLSQTWTRPPVGLWVKPENSLRPLQIYMSRVRCTYSGWY